MNWPYSFVFGYLYDMYERKPILVVVVAVTFLSLARPRLLRQLRGFRGQFPGIHGLTMKAYQGLCLHTLHT